MYDPHGVSAASGYICGAFGRVSVGHDGSHLRCAAATPTNKPATMAGGVRGAHRGPWCTHARVPAQKGDAVFPGRPSHTGSSYCPSRVFVDGPAKLLLVHRPTATATTSDPYWIPGHDNRGGAGAFGRRVLQVVNRVVAALCALGYHSRLGLHAWLPLPGT